MPEWRVTLERNIELIQEVDVVVEAETEEEAEDIAVERAKSGTLYWDDADYGESYIDVVEIKRLAPGEL